MYNWSTDEKKLRKNKRKFAIWKIEQMANFGLNGKKISKNQLRKHWSEIQIDPIRRKFLSLLLYGKKGLNKKTAPHS